MTAHFELNILGFSNITDNTKELIYLDLSQKLFYIVNIVRSGAYSWKISLESLFKKITAIIPWVLNLFFMQVI